MAFLLAMKVWFQMLSAQASTPSVGEWSQVTMYMTILRSSSRARTASLTACLSRTPAASVYQSESLSVVSAVLLLQEPSGSSLLTAQPGSVLVVVTSAGSAASGAAWADAAASAVEGAARSAPGSRAATSSAPARARRVFGASRSARAVRRSREHSELRGVRTITIVPGSGPQGQADPVRRGRVGCGR